MSMFRVTKIIKPIQFIAIRSCSYFAVHHKAKKRGLFVSIFGYELKRNKMDVLGNLIETSDLPQFQKSSLKWFVTRNKERELEESAIRDLIEKVGNVKNFSEIIFWNDEVVFYSVNSKDENEWDYKYPIRSLYFKEGRWNRTNTVCPNLDIAFLVYLEKKYIGDNSDFSYFAMKMLDIDTNH